jgi:hypothetical protein
MHNDDLKDSPPSYDRSFSNYQKHPTFYTEDVFFEASDASGVASMGIADSPKLVRQYHFQVSEILSEGFPDVPTDLHDHLTGGSCGGRCRARES